MSTTTNTPTQTPSGSTQSGGSGALKEKADATLGSAKGEVANVAGSAVEHAKSVIHSATDEAREQGTAQTKRLAHSLHDISDELRSMSEQSSGSTPVTNTVRSIAQVTGDLADRLDQGGPEGVMEDVARFGRRRPVTFLAIAALGGFVTARIVRSADTDRLKDAATGDDAGSRPDTTGSETTGSDTGSAAGDTPNGQGRAPGNQVPGMSSSVLR